MKETNKKIKRFLSVFLMLVILMSVFTPTAVEAKPMVESSFDYLQDILELGPFVKAKKPFPQPVGQFTIEASDGQKISSVDFPSFGTEYDILANWEAKGKPRGLHKFPTTETIKTAPVALTVPVGTKLKLTDISKGSARYDGKGTANIVYRDFQHFYLSPDHLQWYGGKVQQGASKSVTWTADKEGYMYILLQVGDNNDPYRNGWVNHQSSGNYRTAGVNYFNYIENQGKAWDNKHGASKDWFYTMVKVQVGNKSEVVLREMELIDPTNGKVLESFKRNLDSSDPFNKQTIQATHPNIKGASALTKGKTYKVRAKYQYIDFSKGSFNISKDTNMTPEQRALSTGIAPNTLDVKYAYNEKASQQGQFDLNAPVTGTTTELKNLQTASFEWNYTVPKDKKAVKIAGFVPKTFPKSKNASDKDDWGTLYAMIEPKDLALNHPIELYYGKGQRTSVPVPVDTHSVKLMQMK